MSVPKNGFLDMKEAAGLPVPPQALELISSLVEGIFNMSSPLHGCSTLLIAGLHMCFLCSPSPQEAPVEH